MKPEAPPSSAAIRMMSVNWSKGTPADRTAHGRPRICGQPPAAFRRTGIFELEQVDVQVVEGPGRLDDGVFAGLAAKVFPGRG